MRAILVVILLLAPTVGNASPATEVKQLLDTQAAAWNRKDLEGFMAGYWKSDQLTFFSGGKVTHGWQATLDNYTKKYTGPGKELGQLSFTDLEVIDLGPGVALARGRFHLAMTSSNPEGIFSLILRKLPEGWRIIHDHTSG
jgi:beta-aspartyl-peptidase (threonine type)